MNTFSLSVRCPQCGREGTADINFDDIRCPYCGNEIAQWNQSSDEYDWNNQEDYEPYTEQGRS